MMRSNSSVIFRAAWTWSLLLSAVAVAADRAWPPADPLVVPAEESAGALPPSVKAEALPSGAWRCTLWVAPGPNVKRVALVGDFNKWNRDANPLTGPDGNGRWSVTLELPAGVHRYKFLVDGDQWRQDPQNPDAEHDGHGGNNSLLKLGALANLTESKAKLGDGEIDGRALLHDSTSPVYFQYLGDKLLLRLRTLQGDLGAATAAVRTSVKSGKTEAGSTVSYSAVIKAPMTVVKDRQPFTWWEATVPLADLPVTDKTAQLEYVFILTDGSRVASSPKIYEVKVSDLPVFKTPDWAKHAIWYQIFPERFRNGETANDPARIVPWTAEWFATQPWEGKDGRTFYDWFVYDRRYGGDLQGVIEKLPYLKELGINAIYFNPVFKGESLHKYDATSYVHIDDHFGTKGDYAAAAAKEDLLDPNTWTWTESDKLFLDLIKQCKKLGIRVILDGVFNHVGVAHEAFQDVKNKGRESRFADWFSIESFEPFRYRGWAGVADLPEFSKNEQHGLASEAVRKHIFDITRRWMDPNGDGDPSDGIDGWRLDVPNEVPMAFWVEWRKVVKSINPDAYITGEIWQRADQWLDGRTFDAVMNYEFAKAIVNWVFDVRRKITASEFDSRLRELRLAYPLEATLVMQNLMASHDTDRVASMAFNPDRVYDDGNRIQDNGPNYNNAKPDDTAYAKVRLALLIQMTYLGAPMFFYGDEAGMWGADDPTCRKPMLWEDLQPYEKPEENFVMKDHLAFYKKAIALRNAHPALRTGAFQTLLSDDKADVWAFLRTNDEEQLVVALNASSEARTVRVPVPASAPTQWKGVFNIKGTVKVADHALELEVPPLGGVVLHAETSR